MDNRPLKVFLCHAHADRDPVRGLYTRLTQDGVDAWLDKAKLLPGQDWELEIRKAVREADVVVVCLSKQFNQAGFRQKEVRLALDTAMEKPEGEIFIIPARLEECDNLESLRKWHWVDLFEEDGYEMLMRALRARADRIGATLQIKKSWLPNITPPRPIQQKPLAFNQPVAQEEIPVPRLEVEKPKRKLSLKRLIGRAGLAFLGVLSVFTLVLSFWKPPSQRTEPTHVVTAESKVGTQVINSPSFSVDTIETQTTVFTSTQTIFPEKSCEVTLKTKIGLFEIPASKLIQTLELGKLVSVVGILDSKDWYLVKADGDVQGWVDSSLITDLEGCTIKEFSLGDAVLLLTSDEKVELVDDFNGDTQFHFFSGQPEFVVLEGEESVLRLGATSMGRKIFLSLGNLISNENPQRGSETFRMVFKVNYDRNGFISLQWGDHYPFRELRIYPKMNIYILNDVSGEDSTFIDSGTFVCDDSHSWSNTSYLVMNYKKEENIVIAQVDDCGLITFTQFGGFGNLFYLMPYDLNTLDLYYLLVTNLEK